mmetsp:Transcript_9710/g.17501  ORF Transcript_9710/g.17501 Transcript_9710/m.17501 type:complete len:107 (-) Transcript_9710:565-885(-)
MNKFDWMRTIGLKTMSIVIGQSERGGISLVKKLRDGSARQSEPISYTLQKLHVINRTIFSLSNCSQIQQVKSIIKSRTTRSTQFPFQRFQLRKFIITKSTSRSLAV